MPVKYTSKTRSKTKQHGVVKFAAENIFVPSDPSNFSFALAIAPGADSTGEYAPFGTTFALLQNHCRYEGFCIGDATVVRSVVTGSLVRHVDGRFTSDGYEWGELDSGDYYLAEAHEIGDATSTKGTWKLIHGTGRLAGIEGEGTYDVRPKPNEPVIRGTLHGWYRLAARKTEEAS